MKKSNKTPRIVVAVLATLLVIGGLILLRSYLLSAYIGADTTASTTIKTKSVIKGDFASDTLTNVQRYDTTVRANPSATPSPVAYLGLTKPAELPKCSSHLTNTAYPSSTATPIATATASSTPSPEPACLKSTTIKVTPTLTGGTSDAQKTKFYRGVSPNNSSQPNETINSGTAIDFSTSDKDVANVNAAGLRVGTHQGYLQVAFGGQAANTFVEGTLKFSGSYLTVGTKSITKALEDGDYVNVDFNTNTVSYKLTSNSTTDLDMFNIYYCCGTPTARQGEIQGEIPLAITTEGSYYVNKMLLNFTISGANQPNLCNTTDVQVRVSKDGTNWEDWEDVQTAKSVIEFDNTVAIKKIGYRIWLKSCNGLDSPRISSISVTGAKYKVSATPTILSCLQSKSTTATIDFTGASSENLKNFFVGDNTTAQPSGSTINFGSFDNPSIGSLERAGLKVSRKKGYLRVMFNKQAAGASVEGKITFANANLNSNAIQQISGYGLEAADSATVNAATKTVTFKLTSQTAKENDGFDIVYCCISSPTTCGNPAVATPTATITSACINTPPPCADGKLPPKTGTDSKGCATYGACPTTPTPVSTVTYPIMPSLTPTPTGSIPVPPNPDNPTESLVPGQSPQPTVTPTVVVVEKIFGQGSAGQFLASGIKSGPSFWIFIVVVAGIGGYIVYRIAISKE